jgi:5-methylcytosine-specific restriction protein A
MPLSARRPCAYPGCPELVASGRCAKHQQARAFVRERERQNLYDRRWQRIRKSYLTAFPWCADCLAQGRYTPATDVHHEVRHQGNRAIFLSSPLRSLCHACHSRRTAAEVKAK